jgi:Domain of unknown function (DUF4198)
MQMGLRSIALVCGFIHAAGASAHEFWIEAEADSAAHVFVGQMLTGDSLPFLDRTIRSAQHFGPAGENSLNGRQGDIPALNVDLTLEGLHIISVETEPAYIVFDDMKDFGDYLGYEGLPGILDRHRSRGLPEQEIAEEYLRYAKMLVASGPEAPAVVDQALGLRYELVSLSSPFDTKDGTIALQLLWEGSPQAGSQISFFYRSEADPTTVERKLLHSDAAGKVSAKLSGPGFYLFNAVHMVAVDGPGSVVWQSHWASLSFGLSGRSGLQ